MLENISLAEALSSPKIIFGHDIWSYKNVVIATGDGESVWDDAVCHTEDGQKLRYAGVMSKFGGRDYACSIAFAGEVVIFTNNFLLIYESTHMREASGEIGGHGAERSMLDAFVSCALIDIVISEEGY